MKALKVLGTVVLGFLVIVLIIVLAASAILGLIWIVPIVWKPALFSLAVVVVLTLCYLAGSEVLTKVKR